MSTHRARKRFGQHFLTDDNVIADIVAAIAPRDGDTLVAVSEHSPAYKTKQTCAVKIITKAEEAAGKRYLGNGETLTNGKGEKLKPRVGRLLIEVEGRPYWAMAWGVAQRASARMRGLALIAQRQARRRLDSACSTGRPP